MRFAIAATVAACVTVSSGGTARAQSDPAALIKKAIQAHGGAEKMEKTNASRAKVKGTVDFSGMVLPFTTETTAQLPNKLRTVIELDLMGNKFQITQVFNGEKAWMSAMGQVQEVPEPLLGEMKETVYASRVQSLVPLIKEEGFKLDPAKEVKVGGKPADGVKVSSKGHKDVTLYFDRDTGLLVKAERKALDNNQVEVFRETVLSEYKEIDGVKTAMKLVVSNDGAKYVDSTVLEMTFLDKVDPKTFDKP